MPRTDGCERSEMVVTRQDHHQGLLDEKAERQVWHPSFPSKKSCIDCSLHKCTREQRRVLTRYHHVDVRQFVVQDLQGLPTVLIRAIAITTAFPLQERSPSMRCGHTRIRFLLLCKLGGMLRSIPSG